MAWFYRSAFRLKCRGVCSTASLWRSCRCSMSVINLHHSNGKWNEQLVGEKTKIIFSSLLTRWTYRIIESVRLENITRITSSKCQPITPMSTKPCRSMPTYTKGHKTFWWYKLFLFLFLPSLPPPPPLLLPLNLVWYLKCILGHKKYNKVNVCANGVMGHIKDWKGKDLQIKPNDIWKSW